MFAYCLNNAVNGSDPNGLAGENIEFYKGWFYRIDPENTSTGTKRHIHIWHNKQSYSQNDDGSPHDKNSNNQGFLPRRVQEALEKETGWDYNGKHSSFFDSTLFEALDDGSTICVFADGTVVQVEGMPLFHQSGSTAFYEEIYCGSALNAENKLYFVPLLPALPSCTFSFSGYCFPILFPAI